MRLRPHALRAQAGLRFRYNRGMPETYIPLLTPPESLSEPALWFAFQKSELLICRSDNGAGLPCCLDLAEHGLNPARTQYLGIYAGKHCFTVEIPEGDPAPEGWALMGLRDAFAQLEETLAALSGRAYQILDWDRNHQFCSRCGVPTALRTDERSRTCPDCGLTSYPPISPAIMILVTDGRKMLLGRRSIWPEKRYSALAGFVEPGETLEDTVRRETKEEVGVDVKNIRYFGSQPWPFPHSLMIAFTAEYAGGEVKPDGQEIAEAYWFEPETLPKLPPSISISRRLIDTVAARLAAGQSANPWS
jgi:NAD+ diphosphatase